MTDTERDYLCLKWGTLKAWQMKTPAGKAALQKYYDSGPRSMSAISQRDTDEQKAALIELIDAVNCDTIFLDWDGVDVSKDEAKEYVLKYGGDK